MAKHALSKHGLSIRLACETFGISETCYRYRPKLSGDNAHIADWLLRLRYNPFYSYLQKRVLHWLEAAGEEAG